MPANSLPSIFISRGVRLPPVKHTTSNSFFNFETLRSVPMLIPVTNFIPSFCHTLMRLSRTPLSSLKSGMPYRSMPPILSSRSNTVTLSLIYSPPLPLPPPPLPFPRLRRPDDPPRHHGREARDQVGVALVHARRLQLAERGEQPRISEASRKVPRRCHDGREER